jgi:membrane-bound lytic murein transglycosylase F
MDWAGKGSPVWMALLLVLPILAMAEVFKHVDHEHWPKKFDRYFKKYSKHYFGAGFDWRWFKAQGIAESNLRPQAISSVGAKGIMQIMPSTFAEIQKKNPAFKHIGDSRWNIAAGVYYDRQLYRRCEKNFKVKDCLPFAFGAYNAGFGSLRKAYRKAQTGKQKVSRWLQVSPHVPGQTRHYVKRIYKLMKKTLQ